MKQKKEYREALKKTLDKHRIIEDDTKCYGWIGSVQDNCFPRIFVHNKAIAAHRATWIETHGEIPPNRYIIHTCKNKLCTNANHLCVSKHKSVRTKNETYQRTGRLRLSVDLPEEIVRTIHDMADKYNQTLTKYLLKRFIEIIEYEKRID